MTSNISWFDTIFHISLASSIGTFTIECKYNVSLNCSVCIFLALLASYASTLGSPIDRTQLPQSPFRGLVCVHSVRIHAS